MKLHTSPVQCTPCHVTTPGLPKSHKHNPPCRKYIGQREGGYSSRSLPTFRGPAQQRSGPLQGQRNSAKSCQEGSDHDFAGGGGGGARAVEGCGFQGRAGGISSKTQAGVKVILVYLASPCIQVCLCDSRGNSSWESSSRAMEAKEPSSFRISEHVQRFPPPSICLLKIKQSKKEDPKTRIKQPSCTL